MRLVPAQHKRIRACCCGGAGVGGGGDPSEASDWLLNKQPAGRAEFFDFSTVWPCCGTGEKSGVLVSGGGARILSAVMDRNIEQK